MTHLETIAEQDALLDRIEAELLPQHRRSCEVAKEAAFRQSAYAAHQRCRVVGDDAIVEAASMGKTMFGKLEEGDEALIAAVQDSLVSNTNLAAWRFWKTVIRKEPVPSGRARINYSGSLKIAKPKPLSWAEKKRIKEEYEANQSLQALLMNDLSDLD